MPFVCEITPRFDQLDPAGIVFFGEVFTISSGVYEGFVQSLGFTWDQWFKNPECLSPIRHAEAEYLKPLEGGQRYHVGVEILTLGASSFRMGYVFERLGVTHCRVQIVHVFMDSKTRSKIAVPEHVREAFMRYGVRDASAASS